MPYAPPLTHWFEAWRFLRRERGLDRGHVTAFREHLGPVVQRADGRLYASTSLERK